MHNFRRSFATIAIKNNVNLFVLQRLMSHSSIKTTQKYVNLTVDDLKQNYSSPLDKLINNNKIKISMKRGK